MEIFVGICALFGVVSIFLYLPLYIIFRIEYKGKEKEMEVFSITGSGIDTYYGPRDSFDFANQDFEYFVLSSKKGTKLKLSKRCRDLADASDEEVFLVEFTRARFGIFYEYDVHMILPISKLRGMLK